jgi:hypothetical protein
VSSSPMPSGPWPRAALRSSWSDFSMTWRRRRRRACRCRELRHRRGRAPVGDARVRAIPAPVVDAARRYQEAGVLSRGLRSARQPRSAWCRRPRPRPWGSPIAARSLSVSLRTSFARCLPATLPRCAASDVTPPRTSGGRNSEQFRSGQDTVGQPHGRLTMRSTAPSSRAAASVAIPPGWRRE